MRNEELSLLRIFKSSVSYFINRNDYFFLVLGYKKEPIINRLFKIFSFGVAPLRVKEALIKSSAHIAPSDFSSNCIK